MQRTIYLNAQPFYQARQFVAQKDFEVLAPAQLAAKALGVRKRSLSDIAQQLLQKQGVQFASPLIAQQTLHQVIAQTTALDAEGTTRAVFPTIKTLLQATPTLETLNSVQSPRVQQLVQYARAYRAKLRLKYYMNAK